MTQGLRRHGMTHLSGCRDDSSIARSSMACPPGRTAYAAGCAVSTAWDEPSAWRWILVVAARPTRHQRLRRLVGMHLQPDPGPDRNGARDIISYLTQAITTAARR